MAKTITLKAAYINGLGGRADKKNGAKTVFINFIANWTKGVASKLEWPGPQGGQDSVKLKGGMNIYSIGLVVGEKTFHLGSGTFKGLTVVTVETDSKKKKFEIHGQYTTGLPKILAMAERYMDETSRAVGDLVIEYDKIEEEEVEGEDEDAQLELA